MFINFFRKQRRLLVVVHDIIVIPLAWFAAFWLRFNMSGIPVDALEIAYKTLPVVVVTQILAYWQAGLYRGVWRFASMPDLMRIFRAVFVASFLSFIMIYFFMGLNWFPRSVLPLYSILIVSFLGGSRFAVRWLKEYKNRAEGAIRMLVIGADQAGEGIVRDLLRDNDHAYKPVAFVDDKANKIGQEIHGIRVVGHIKDIPQIVKEYAIQLIIIAMPSANAEAMRRIMKYCEGLGCPINTLPALNDLVAGRVSVDLLREVSLEDLLGRDPVSLDWHAIETSIIDKIVLVSGAGGSIGSELCRQIARLKPKKLIAIEHSEYNLFMLEQEFCEKFPEIVLVKHLVNVCDRSAMHQIISNELPEVVFHAAAYKHVPLLQSQPREAIANNIFGTRCIAELAMLYGVRKFILVSTDKAVNPTNIMGATKRVSEMICQGLNGKGLTQFITVRFGNVLGSAGSVVPIFQRQLRNGGPLTVTHPDVTRFFMTIPEACQLILQSLIIGKGGEIFVLDMGEPMKIQYLAEQIIRLAGKKPGQDIEITYTGLRPGEKLFEELFHANEKLAPTSHIKIFQAQARELDWEWLKEILLSMDEACVSYDENTLQNILQRLVPELEISNRSHTATNPMAPELKA